MISSLIRPTVIAAGLTLPFAPAFAQSNPGYFIPPQGRPAQQSPQPQQRPAQPRPQPRPVQSLQPAVQPPS
ncbi:MAG: hypothetical protein M3N26_08705, partial [Pseudomonadota bacterium]|nr:hypothetical protein [Pseudomonadota bacterium]